MAGPPAQATQGPRVISAETVLLIELLCAVVVLAFCLTGRRGEFLDSIHPRADAILVVLTACAVAASHFMFVRRILPVLRRRASPIEYDHQRILLELGDAARHSNNLADVYKFSVNTVAHALDVASVAILVRDQETGNFLVRSSSIEQGERTNSSDQTGRGSAADCAHAGCICSPPAQQALRTTAH